MKTLFKAAVPVARSSLTGSIAGRRCFSSSSSTQATWGFIGLGQMGYRMAKNLSAKLPKEDTLYINDVNKAAMEAFKKEIAADADVKIASSPREVAENA
ncbi:hypothetical protein LTS18_013969, partial [Coniosporium uncinatum]